MKKFLTLLLALAMIIAVMAIASAEEMETGSYTFYNETGETVTELYVYPVGSEDKGANLAPFHGPSLKAEYTAAHGTHLVVEFVTESGYVGTFDNLAIEVAPITLLSADGMTGPTMISFTVPTGTGKYTLYNMTGEDVTELYLYPVGSEDKGANLAPFHGPSMNVTYEATMDTHLVLEFITASGYVGTFNQLAIEVAPITLLSADGMTGPTMISFTVPTGTGKYTLYNMTGEDVTELYLYPVGSEDKGANLAPFHGPSMNVTYEATMDTHLVLEFITASGYVGTFNQLAIEVAPITLLSADGMTGPTMISFTVPTGTGKYTLYNMTGEDVTELYLYPVGSEDKGANLAPFHGPSMNVTYEATMDTHLVLEFITASGYVGTFNQLAIEVAPITLLSADGMTGPTMISFTVPTGTGKYTLYNMTGEDVTELYLYPVGSEDKGANLAPFHGPSMNVTYEATMDTHLVLEFITASGYVGTFDKLAIEVAPITLLSADGMTGPTMISFTVPEGTGVYTMYNLTGETLTDLYIYPVGSEDNGENYAVDFADGKVIEITAPMSTKLMVVFVTESGYVGYFDKLSIEVAPISLLSADAMTGPTMINFSAPQQ